MAIQPFIVQQSDDFTIAGRQEVDQNLSLTPSSDFGSIVGTVNTVLNETVEPVANATVKVFTEDGVPFEHVNTNDQW